MKTLEESLAHLLDALIDSRNGYEEASKKADRPNMKGVFRHMIELRTAHIVQLQEAFAIRRMAADASGTLMSTVHRTVVDLRSVLTGLNPGSLASFASGEENILNGYDQSLGKAGVDTTLVELLTGQREAIATEIGRMRQSAKAA